MSPIRCEDCREYLLSAEPHQLAEIAGGLPDGGGADGVGGDLREHTRSCEGCASLARAILAENARLDDAVARLTVMRASEAARGETKPHGAVTAAPGWSRRRAWRRWAAALVPLAAAAALVVVIWQQAPRSPASLVPLTGPAVRVPATPAVNAIGASGVAVMRTNDPNITVVWTF